MTTKRYDDIDGEWGKNGEAAIRQYFVEQGYTVTALPNGIYEQDLMFKTKHEHFYVEVERCGTDRWSAEKSFSFSTINVLARREVTPDRLFFTVRADLRQAYIMFPDDIKALAVTRKSNKHVKDERVREYPVERALLLDFERPVEHSIAAMNAERIRNIVNDKHLSYKFKMAVLRGKKFEFGPPYGMVMDDWTTSIAFVEKTSGLSQLVSMPIHSRQTTIEF